MVDIWCNEILPRDFFSACIPAFTIEYYSWVYIMTYLSLFLLPSVFWIPTINELFISYDVYVYNVWCVQQMHVSDFQSHYYFSSGILSYFIASYVFTSSFLWLYFLHSSEGNRREIRLFIRLLVRSTFHEVKCDVNKRIIYASMLRNDIYDNGLHPYFSRMELDPAQCMSVSQKLFVHKFIHDNIQ